MNKEDQELLYRIQAYSEVVLAGIDPQKVQISVQLEKLKPIMEELAKERNCKVEDIFIKYMDLASLASVQKEQEFQNDLGFSNQANNPNLL